MMEGQSGLWHRGPLRVVCGVLLALLMAQGSYAVDGPPTDGDTALAAKDYAKAATRYTDYLDTHPTGIYRPTATVGLAQCYIAATGTPRAIALLEDLHAAKPEGDPRGYGRGLRYLALLYQRQGQLGQAAQLRNEAYAFAERTGPAGYVREIFEDYCFGQLSRTPHLAIQEMDALLQRPILLPADIVRLRYLRLKYLSLVNAPAFADELGAAITAMGAAPLPQEIERATGLVPDLYRLHAQAQRVGEVLRVHQQLGAVLKAQQAETLVARDTTACLHALFPLLPKAPLGMPAEPGAPACAPAAREAYWAIWDTDPTAGLAHAMAVIRPPLVDEPRFADWWPRFVRLVDQLPANHPQRAAALLLRGQVALHTALTKRMAGEGVDLPMGDFQTLLTAFPGRPEALTAAGALLACAASEKQPDVTAATMAAVAAWPATAPTLDWLARVYAQQGTPESLAQASATLVRLQQLAPDSPVASGWAYRAAAHLEWAGRRAEARVAFQAVDDRVRQDGDAIATAGWQMVAQEGH